MKVYGPYLRKDNRKHVIIVDGENRKTVSYPRYLLEQSLGRMLNKDETVDHIDGDFTNDNLENLQILSLADNIRKTTNLNPRKYLTFVCPVCGTTATKPVNNMANNRRLGRRGPFCSRKCGGIASHIDSHELRMKIDASEWNYLDPTTNKRLKTY